MNVIMGGEYKNTKLGLIPYEWEVIKLNTVCHKIMVGIASSATHAYSDEGIPMFRNQNIKEGGLDDSDLLYINENYEKAHKNKRLKANDILTIRTGYPGLSCVVPLQYENAQCFTSLIIRPIQEVINSNWLVYFINSPIGKKLMKSLEAGGAQKNINSGSLEKLTIPLIDIKEQQKIAQILSQWDEAIETTQNLITQLQLRKKGLMQELLSGKKRLAGFSDEWEERRLGELIIDCKKKTLIQDAYEVLTSSNQGLLPQKEYFSNSRVSDKSNVGFHILPPNHITYRSRSDDGNFTFNLNELGYTGIISHYYPVFKMKNGDNKFFIEYANINKFKFGKYSVGTSQLVLSLNEIKRIKVLFPSESEQKAISKIIGLADTEIKEKQEYLVALQNQKKGLMQQLLTGQKRVKID